MSRSSKTKLKFQINSDAARHLIGLFRESPEIFSQFQVEGVTTSARPRARPEDRRVHSMPMEFVACAVDPYGGWMERMVRHLPHLASLCTSRTLSGRMCEILDLVFNEGLILEAPEKIFADARQDARCAMALQTAVARDEIDINARPVASALATLLATADPAALDPIVESWEMTIKSLPFAASGEARLVLGLAHVKRGAYAEARQQFSKVTQIVAKTGDESWP